MKRLWFLFLLIVLVMAACSPVPVLTETAPAITTPADTSGTESTSTPSATPDPPLVLTVCTAGLPESLFPYNAINSPAKENILSLIQTAPLKSIAGALTSVLLEKVPAQRDGDLRLEPVTVTSGQPVVDARGELVILKPGQRVRPSGCRTADCAVLWEEGASFTMDQMVIEFNIKDTLTWSDGTPLDALDSVFSYTLASSPEAPGLKWAEDRTQAYTAVETHTVRWVSRPGFTTADLEQFFWMPLPAHLFTGDEAWDDVASHQQLSTSPLSYGPFVLASWQPDMIRFTPNPTYSGVGEGISQLDEIVYKVINGGAEAAWNALQQGECDLLDSSFGLQNQPAVLSQIQDDERFDLQVLPGKSWIQLGFGIQPAVYDGYYNFALGSRLDYFSDPRVRQAVGACLDREAVSGVMGASMGEVWQSFLPPPQSQLSEDELVQHDPALGLERLNQAGWRDHDGNPDTPLQAWEVANVPVGSLFSVELLIGPSASHQALAEIIQESLGACGIEVRITSLPAEELYRAGPEGPLFGRAFDLALISWQPLPDSDCGFYQSWQIPSKENRWIGTNLAGLDDNGYDVACTTAALALPKERLSALMAAEQAFLTALPAVPLLAPPSIMVTSAGLGCGEDGWSDQDFLSVLNEYGMDSPCP